MSVALLTATAQAVAAAVPSNDLVSAPTKLALGVAVDYNSADATISATDPTDCNGSHGSFPGPYFASVWFSFTATSNGQLNLSAPTTQGRADDYLAISFVYQQTGSGLTLIDCTAFGNDATWPARKGQTFLIMEAGLSSAVTDVPTAVRHGWPRHDRDHPIGERSPLQLHRSLHVQRLRLHRQRRAVRRRERSICGPASRATPTPYLFDNYEWHIVSTNPANGKWFREDGQGQYRDLHITNVEGTIYTFVSQETGRPYTLTDMNGNKVFFDRGRLLTTFQVDTKGDDDLRTTSSSRAASSFSRTTVPIRCGTSTASGATSSRR